MPLEPALARCLDAVYDGINQGDEAQFIAAFSPGLHYFGSMTGTATHGLSTLRGVFRATRDVVGFERIQVLQTYGQRLECAVRCGICLPGIAEPVEEQMMVFHWDEAGRIDRFSILWDAAGFLARKARSHPPPPREPVHLRPATRAFLGAYLDTYNQVDMEAHSRLLAPEVEVFGSLLNTEIYGMGAARGLFTSAHASLNIRWLTPLHTFGDAPEFAVRMGLARAPGEAPGAEGVWVFRLKEDGRLARLSVLWDPLPYLKFAGG